MSIKIGILGFAHGHVGTYCQQWARQPREVVHLVAGWDHDDKRAASANEQYGLDVADSAAALVARPDVDAVVIGAETSLHADLVERAAAAGKRIVLQKPLALTMAEADRIVAAVGRHGVPFTLAWQMRVDPQNRQIRDLVRGGALGRVFMVRRRHGLSTHAWAGFDQTWHVKPELNRGMWADDAAHAIDFLLWLLGEPETVTAEVATLHNPKVPDDNGIAVFRYADGTFAEITCSFTCLAGENTTEVVAERGTIIQNFGDAPSANAPRPPGAIGLKWLMAGDEQWTIGDVASPANHGERIAALAPEILKFLRGEAPPIATAEEGRTALQMTLACYRSAELGRRVRMDEVT
jgi:predicted dehydrogenase